MTPRGFSVPGLHPAEAAELEERARKARGSVLTMTSAAGSGHPGGSMSSMELLLVLYNYARLRPQDPSWEDRDRIIVSNGHISPGVYAALADAGFFDTEQVEAHFRQADSPFEGHVERLVPGVEWDTGNLGQGLSAGVGMALGSRLLGRDVNTFVVMSDAEQNKGQVAEACRLARKEGLTSVTAIVDVNGVQISGHTDEVMPVDIAALWQADGWRVEEVDGHDVRAIYAALAVAVADTAAPIVVLAHTVIGKGVSFMEDDPAYHGRALTDGEYAAAMGELGLAPRLDLARARRAEVIEIPEPARRMLPVAPNTGVPRTYDAGARVDARSAWGHALTDLAVASDGPPIVVFDCDLAESVKTLEFAKLKPEWFIECGVAEHNAAAAAGACASTGVTTFLADFGVFGIDEVYNQQRLNDINGAGLKLAVTHCGLDVGEDGRTHHCIDYVGALRDFFGWQLVVPADANQTDRAVRYAARASGNVAIAMGRSKLPAVTTRDGQVAYGDGYEFVYGRIDRIEQGGDGCVLVMGTPTTATLAAVRALSVDRGRLLSLGVVSCPLALSDEDIEWMAGHDVVLTIEDHNVRTGLGACVAYELARRGTSSRLVCHGVEHYTTSGAGADLYRLARLDADGIRALLEETFVDGGD